MAAEIAKIRIRVGQVEIDYEGDAAFLDRKLMEMAEQLQKSLANQPRHPAPPQHQGGSHGVKPSLSGLHMSTKTIATKLSAKKGADVARAAIAHLALVKNKETFTRAEIHDEMKEAKGIYKSTMLGNLSAILSSLITGGTIIDTGNEVYALTPEGETDLRGKLGAA